MNSSPGRAVDSPRHAVRTCSFSLILLGPFDASLLAQCLPLCRALCVEPPASFHDRVVAVYGHCTDPEKPERGLGVVMQLCEGNLMELLEEKKTNGLVPLSDYEVLRMALQVAAGVNKLHEVCHERASRCFVAARRRTWAFRLISLLNAVAYVAMLLAVTTRRGLHAMRCHGRTASCRSRWLGFS